MFQYNSKCFRLWYINLLLMMYTIYRECSLEKVSCITCIFVYQQKIFCNYTYTFCCTQMFTCSFTIFHENDEIFPCRRTLWSCSYHYGFLRCFQSNIVIGEMINVFYPILDVVFRTWSHVPQPTHLSIPFFGRHDRSNGFLWYHKKMNWRLWCDIFKDHTLPKIL